VSSEESPRLTRRLSIGIFQVLWEVHCDKDGLTQQIWWPCKVMHATEETHVLRDGDESLSLPLYSIEYSPLPELGFDASSDAKVIFSGRHSLYDPSLDEVSKDTFSVFVRSKKRIRIVILLPRVIDRSFLGESPVPPGLTRRKSFRATIPPFRATKRCVTGISWRTLSTPP